MRLAVVVSILAIGVVGRPLIAAPVSGEAVYQKRCAVCHDSNNARVPPRDVLKKLSAARIVRTLDFGLMMNVASVMTRDEREAVAAFLGIPGGAAAPAPKTYGFEGDVNAIGALTVVGRYLFVGSAGGAVQALDAASGCVHWIFQMGTVGSGRLVVTNT